MYVQFVIILNFNRTFVYNETFKIQTKITKTLPCLWLEKVFKVHLNPPIFFSLKMNPIVIWNKSVKKFSDSVEFLIFCVPMKSRKLHLNTAVLFHDQVLGEWVKRLLWCLPREVEYLMSSHFLQDGAIHIWKVRRNSFQKGYQLLQQYPRFKERYTVPFTGDYWWMVQ